VPAAAVIPAPIAYSKVVAVKKLVVECGPRGGVPWGASLTGYSLGAGCSLLSVSWARRFTVRKLECSKRAIA
jgi:hypothetical protein